MLTVTIERRGEDGDEAEIHLHAGGQGFWIARLVQELGVDSVLCGSFGGETGAVVRMLITSQDLEVQGVETAGSNGAYVHDRRSGERVELAHMAPTELSRHEVDDLYGVVVVEALESQVCVLGGPGQGTVVPADIYRRLAADVRRNGGTILADLAGPPLPAALQGGVDVLKMSDEELQREGFIRRRSRDEIVEAARKLTRSGAESAVISREAEPVLALVDGEVLEFTTPTLEPLDDRGTGDSLTAGIAAALARGEGLAAAIRLGAAAGAINVTRRGLATGRREEIERLSRHVDIDLERSGTTP